MTKTECSVIRAYAILSIFLHNYIHWLPNTPQENEFEFDVNRHWSFINSIISGSDIFINLFSYLGHLGVPVFVFLSGYGLAQKYGQQATIGLKSFIAKHFVKLIKPLLGGMLIYIIVMYIRDGEWPTFHTLVLQCLMLRNIIVPLTVWLARALLVFWHDNAVIRYLYYFCLQAFTSMDYCFYTIINHIIILFGKHR